MEISVCELGQFDENQILAGEVCKCYFKTEIDFGTKKKLLFFRVKGSHQ